MYKADIGSWEKGRKIELPDAVNVQTALREAYTHTQENEIVMQIYTPEGKICYDFMNGIYPQYRV